MAHEIDQSLNQAGAFIARYVPAWHGLGVVIDGEISMAAVLAPGLGIGYEVMALELETMARSSMAGTVDPILEIAVPGYRALVRMDTRAVLSVVSDTYNLVNHVPEFEAFWEILEDQGYQIETAGTLDMGRRVWILFERPKGLVIRGSDESKTYLLAAFDYSGAGAISIKAIAERVVCSNTLRIALGEDGGLDFRITHHSNATERLEAVKGLLSTADEAFEEFGRKAELLAAVQFSPEEAQEMTLAAMTAAFGDPAEKGISKDETESRVKKIKTGAEYVAEALENSSQRAAGIGSKWALYNGISEWADHVLAPSRLKDPRRAQESRFKSALEGRADAVKQEIFSLLYETVDGQEISVPVYGPEPKSDGALLLAGMLEDVS